MKSFKWMKKEKNVGRFRLVPNLHPKFKNLKKTENYKNKFKLEPFDPFYPEPSPRHASFRLCLNLGGS